MEKLKTFEDFFINPNYKPYINTKYLKSVGKNKNFEVFFDADNQEYLVYKDGNFFC